MIIDAHFDLALNYTLAYVAQRNGVEVFDSSRQMPTEFVLAQDIVRDDSVWISLHGPPVIDDAFALIVDAPQLARLVSVVLVL